MRKTVSLLLSFVLLLGMLPTTVLAEGNGDATGSSQINVYENGDDTNILGPDEGGDDDGGELLFQYSDTDLIHMTQFPKDIDTNHDLKFYHAAGESVVEVEEITSSNAGVVAINLRESGFYHVYIAGAGTTTLTYTVGGKNYTVEVTIPATSNPDEGGDDDGGELLFQYSDTDLIHMPQFPKDIDTNHDLKFYHAAGESVVEVEEITSSNAGVVAINLRESGFYHVYIAGAGTTTLTYTVGGKNYTVEVTIPATSNPDEGGDDDGGELLFQYSDTDLIHMPQFPKDIDTNHDLKFYHAAGESVVEVEEITSSNAGVVAINLRESGFYHVYIAGAGTTTLTYTVGGKNYTVEVTIPATSNPDEGGDDEKLTFHYDNDDTKRFELSQFPTEINETYNLYMYYGNQVLEHGTFTSSDSNVIVCKGWGAGPIGPLYQFTVVGSGMTTLTYTSEDGKITCSDEVTIPEGEDPGPGEGGGDEKLTFHYDNDDTKRFELSQFPTEINETYNLYMYYGNQVLEHGTFTSSDSNVIVCKGWGAGPIGPLYQFTVVGSGMTTLTYTSEDGKITCSDEVTIPEGEDPGPGEGGGDGPSEPASSLPVITVNNVDYTIGIADAGGESIVFLGGGVDISCYPGTTYSIAAMSGYGAGHMEEAPAKVYEYITKIEVEVLEYTNLVGDQSQPNSSYTCGTVERNGAKLPSFTMKADEGDYFTSEIVVKVTIKNPETGEATVHQIPTYMKYIETIFIDLNPSATDIPDTKTLNEILASDEAFLAWMEEKYPNDYVRYTAGKSAEAEVLVRLYLPGITFGDGIVDFKVSDKVGLWLWGQEDNGRTVLRGLYLKGCSMFVNNIDFIADPNLKMTYGQDSFTSGILLASDPSDGDRVQGQDFATTYMIENCTFSGFDYAVRNTNHGLGMSLNGCIISDCRVGFYMDSAKMTGGPWMGNIENTLFLRNDTAVQIVTLPSYLEPYNFRVVNCDLIGNDVDFDVVEKGTFYFHSNYFAKVHNQAKDKSSDELIQMLAQSTTEDKLNQVVTSNAPRVNKANGTKVITNPKWKYMIAGNWKRAAMSLMPLSDDPYTNVMVADWELDTQILAKEAMDLTIDASAFDMVTEEKKVIDVVDDKENAIGTWSFD